MSNVHILMTIIVMATLTFALRAMPFIFRRRIENNRFFLFIKDKLPTMIMLILVCYAVGLHDINATEQLDNKLIALLLTLVVHGLLRNFLLSISVGTACYVLLLNG